MSKGEMWCVEMNGRWERDLGACVVVSAKDAFEAYSEARRLYPEHGERCKSGHVYPVAHIEIDWDSGRTLVKRLRVRIPIKPLTPTPIKNRTEEK
jgi:hypothetical protein